MTVLAVPRVRRAALGVVVVAVAVAGGTAYLWQRDVDAAADDGADAPATRATTTAERRTLVDSERVTGTLEYAGAVTVTANGEGTLTALPEEASVLRRGDVAYRVDDLPVVVLLGTLPMWRDLHEGVEGGKDVRQLERNLERLGYDPGTVDQEFTSYTEAALLDLQEDLGVAEDGVAAPSDFVVVEEALRVGAHAVEVGQPLLPGTPVELYAASGLDRVVNVDLDPSDESLAELGAKATVTLPDGTTIRATVSSVGEVETTTAADGTETSTLPVELAVRRPGKVADLDVATVSVDLARDTKKGVVAVPVTALVALAEGGFAVQLVEGAGTPVLTAVEPGLYADGYVEILGGLDLGDTVVVPA
ncbi:peptidoglycan-binding protein [Nocardioides sp. SYSU D00038]|uniref:peptidoglycan-binding protein n=1 Tax=Nocardioides sp. SYSU D00038 TaxID=2812554 RepID=UPI00196728F0|nr:peptidoglycan-binding protein [Nocardioides sp. SYSU D00038]